MELGLKFPRLFANPGIFLGNPTLLVEFKVLPLTVTLIQKLLLPQILIPQGNAWEYRLHRTLFYSSPRSHGFSKLPFHFKIRDNKQLHHLWVSYDRNKLESQWTFSSEGQEVQATVSSGLLPTRPQTPEMSEMSSSWSQSKSVFYTPRNWMMFLQLMFRN